MPLIRSVDMLSIAENESIPHAPQHPQVPTIHGSDVVVLSGRHRYGSQPGGQAGAIDQGVCGRGAEGAAHGAHRVADFVRAVIAGGRRVGESPVGIQRQRTIRRTGRHRPGYSSCRLRSSSQPDAACSAG